MPADALPLTYASSSVTNERIGVLLDDLPRGVFVMPDAPAAEHGAVVLGVEAPDGPTSFVDMHIGRLVGMTRMLVCARCKLWWMTPEWRDSTLELPPETQFLLAELPGGGARGGDNGNDNGECELAAAYALLLPLIDGSFRTTLRAGGTDTARARRGGPVSKGDLTLRVESGDARVKAGAWGGALYVAAGTDPYALVERGVAEAARLSGSSAPLPRKQLPASLDLFGWCTWDAFYSTVSARGIRQGLESLAAGGLPPRTLIIDDGWQSTDVDPAFRKAPTSELAEALHLKKEQQALVESTDQVMYDESMEVLADVSSRFPPSSTTSAVMPGISKLGREAMRYKHMHHGSMDAEASADSRGSMDAPAAVQKPKPGDGVAMSADSRASMDRPAAGARPQPGDGAAAAERRPAGTAEQNAAEVAESSAPSRVPPPAPSSAPARQQPPAPQVEVLPGAAAPHERLAAELQSSPLGGGVSEDAVLVVRMAQRLVGWVIGLGTAAFLIFYQAVVEPAAPGSWPTRWFTRLAGGPLRPLMLAFFANASDFTRRLVSVKANGKFCHPDAGPDDEWGGRPEALGDVVAALKAQYGLDYVYCWHGLPAYWGGVMPDAQEFEAYRPTLMFAQPTPGVLEIEPSMAWNPAVLGGVGVVQDPRVLYDSMHAYLASSGIDGVKVDCQAGVGLVGSALGGGAALSRRFHDALETSVKTHFDGNHCINCMCHSTENLYRMTNTAVARVSDDFYPREPASSSPHIAACAYNSVFMSALVQPDWDMFHSMHPSAETHAIARALSGGAVYVSDKPGDHDFALLRLLVLPDGSTLRAAGAARPSRDCLFADVLRDGRSLLKAWNTNRGGGRVVGVYHLQGSSWDRTRRKFHVHDAAPRALATTVQPADCEAGAAELHPAAASPPRYAMYTVRGKALAVVGGGGRDGVRVELAAGEAEAVAVAPLLDVGSSSVALIGLCDMYNSGGAVLGVDVVASSNGSGGGTCNVSMRGCGRFLAHCSVAPSSVAWRGNGQSGAPTALEFTYDASSGAMHVEVPRTDDMRATLTIAFD